MAMSKSDYELVAKTFGEMLAREGNPSARSTIQKVASALAAMFGRANRAFDEACFVDAIKRAESDALDLGEAEFPQYTPDVRR